MVEAGINIIVEPAREGDVPFIPPSQQVQFVLEPEVVQTPTITPPAADFFFELEPEEFEPFVVPESEKRQIVIDIETTGTKPWESRIIAIGWKMADEPFSDPEVIVGESERDILTQFFQVLQSKQPQEFIGYFAGFDFRFIFTKAALYRLPAKEFVDLEIRDVANILQQVKEAFVFQLNPVGKLNDWAKELLGKEKNFTIEELFDAWEARDFQAIQAFNANDVQITWELWQLIRFIQDVPIVTELATRTSPEKFIDIAATVVSETASTVSVDQEEGTKRVRCPDDLSEVTVDISATSVVCPVDGRTLTIS